MIELEQELRRLRTELEFPPTPDLAASIRARLEHRRGWWPRRRSLAIVLAALAVAVVAAMAVPAARTAILDWLGLRGVEISFVERLPEVPTNAQLALGERVTLAQARRRSDHAVLLPRIAGLDEPDIVYFGGFWEGDPVTFVYGSEKKVRLLMTQFRGDPLIEKKAVEKKGLQPGSRVEPVSVDGARGLWLSGAPHSFVFVDEAGRAVQETLRLARNTLLWEQRDLTLRIEGAFTKAEALEIARSVR